MRREKVKSWEEEDGERSGFEEDEEVSDFDAFSKGAEVLFI